MSKTQQTDRRSQSWAERRNGRRVLRLVRHIQSFAEKHGGSAEGHIGYLGERGVRLVLVGSDGGWGDLVAPTRDIAVQAAERAGLTVHDALDGEFAARLRTGPREWSRMAGIQLS